MKQRIIFLSGIFIFFSEYLQAQDTVSLQVESSFRFINNKANILHNADSLSHFYAKLLKLKKTNQGIVNILHIGDSHIQADFFTGTTRTLLQKEFGNAGLGLSFPGRAALTNESQCINSSSVGKWESQRLINAEDAETMGIGGITLKTNFVGNSIKIKTINQADQQYAFNRLSIFFQKDFSSYHAVVKDSIGQPLAFIGPYTEEANNVSRLVLPYSINQVQIETIQTSQTQKHFTFFGISFENSNPGVRYHILGANGVKYKHFNLAPELLEQTNALAPDLIILSLGANEAADHPNIDHKFEWQIEVLVSELRQFNPNAIILLTTPADFYKSQTNRNPGIQTIKNKIVKFAEKNKLPYWNLHEVAGGNRAADSWKKERLLNADGIHFLNEGYKLQGRLLFEAIIKGYNEYVLHRHLQTH